MLLYEEANGYDTIYSLHFGTVRGTSANNVQKQLGLNKMLLDTI